MQKKRLKPIFLSILLLFIFVNGQELVASSTVTLNANGPGNTYALIRSKGYGLEVPDCGHPTKHISEAWDNELGKYVFLFDIHRDLDDDRCVNNDRQRTEIKTYSVSPDNMKAQYGETHVFKWKFRLDKNYQPSDAFCHIHQINASGGDAAMPIVTISTRSGSPDVLRLAHSSSGSTGGIVKEVPLSLFRGVWVEVYEKIKNADNGTWEITIKRVDNGATLISYSNNKIDMWRTGASYNRSKYGIYRSLGDISSLRNERVRFADFFLAEGEDIQIGSESSADLGDSGGGCFIATAAFGSPLELHVVVLKKFRDVYLQTNRLGRKFIQLYYEISPPIADYIAANPGLKLMVRAFLYPLVGISYAVVNFTALQNLQILAGLALLVGSAFMVMRRKRRKI